MKKNILIVILSSVIFSCSKEIVIPQYTLTVTSNLTEAGSVSPSSGTYNEGTSVSISATPNQDYLFINWTGSYSSTDNPLSIQMMRNENLTANFSNQPDTDGDGIPDYRDSEPNTRAGVPVDANGKMENPVYLAENGVTVKAKDWSLPGDEGEIDGVKYFVYPEDGLNRNMYYPGDAIYVFTKLKINARGIHFYLNELTKKFINSWDVSNLTDLSDLFYNINIEYLNNADLSHWDVSNVKYMTRMFGYSSFNGNISSWDVGNVEDMNGMFVGSVFNGDLSNWDVRNVINMYGMFAYTLFNQDLSKWDVSNVMDMTTMFAASKFNQDLSSWNLGKTNLSFMFAESIFNQNISNWDVSNVTNMQGMFFLNKDFNQDLSNWQVNGVTNCRDFSTNTSAWTLPKPNFTNCTPTP
jgi:hypothetical protein